MLFSKAEFYAQSQIVVSSFLKSTTSLGSEMTDSEDSTGSNETFRGGLVKTEVLTLAHALSFLTRFPLPAFSYHEALQSRSVCYFPLVGFIIGLIGAGVFEVATLIWPASVAIVFAMIATVISTGAFHEDGLADSADGIGGGWTVDDKLRIMKDSRIGTYGGLALILTMLLKFTSLNALPENQISAAFILAHVLGRWSTLPLLRYCSYIGGGSGNPFAGSVTPIRIVAATLGMLLITVLFAGESTLAIAVSVLTITLISGLFFRSQIAGITGDSLGAANQLVEVTVYLVLLWIVSH
ncbi:MAG: adenosylcobinamide-GDP ribazoletransferase [Halioglobus sp.]